MTETATKSSEALKQLQDFDGCIFFVLTAARSDTI